MYNIFNHIIVKLYNNVYYIQIFYFESQVFFIQSMYCITAQSITNNADIILLRIYFYTKQLIKHLRTEKHIHIRFNSNSIPRTATQTLLITPMY